METLLFYTWQATKRSPENVFWLIIVLLAGFADTCNIIHQQVIDVFD